MINLRRHATQRPTFGAVHQPLTDNLVLEQFFHQDGGNVLTDLVNPWNKVALTGTTLWAYTDKGIAFDGNSNNYGTITDNPSLTVGTRPFTVEVLVKKDASTGDQQILFGRDTDTKRQWFLAIQNDGYVYLSDFVGGNGLATTAAACNANSVWYHVVYTRGGGAGANFHTFYVNGVLIQQTNGIGSLADYTAGGSNIGIGRRLYPSFPSYVDGKIALCRFWIGRALTPTEVQSLWVNPYQTISQEAYRVAVADGGGAAFMARPSTPIGQAVNRASTY